MQLDRAADATGSFDDGVAWAQVSAGTIEARIGLSLVSVDGARKNLLAEAADVAFDDLHDAARAAWDDALGRIVVEGGTEAETRTFYSALYHVLVHPSVASDVDGQHLRFDGAIGNAAAPRYHIFSLWDTYRTVHPLLSLVYPERQLEIAQSLVDMTIEAGVPPRWELAGEETNVMVGDPTDIVIADTVARGLVPDRLAQAMPLLVAAASDPSHRPGIDEYVELGYVPMDLADDLWGPVSTTLEYALADAALAQLLESQGTPDPDLVARSRGFTALWDGSFLHPRFADGTFLDPFDPDAIEGSQSYHSAGGPGYVEGTAWTYLFATPHALPELAALMGGDAALLDRVDAFFEQKKALGWNEPDLAYPYLYSHIDGALGRTGPAVRAALQRFTDARDGLPGNDDAGTLSAFYVWSAIGLYPDVPGAADYAIGSPIFDRIELHLPAGTFTIDAPHPSPAHLHPTGTARIAHSTIAGGGSLHIELVP
jgi:predicted alpha-1,2-mannosidase